MSNPNDIVIKQVSTSYQDLMLRTPLKFAGKVVTELTLLNVQITVVGKSGSEASGSGSMILGNTWSWPSEVYDYHQTLDVMKHLAERIRVVTQGSIGHGHPVGLMLLLEQDFQCAADQLAVDMHLEESIPKLCTLVVTSPFDAALHDAYGKLHRRNVYCLYGQEFMNQELSACLNDDFKGEYLDQYTLREPKERMPLYHLVGALDALTDNDVGKRLEDGLPNTLQEWIVKDGLTHFKIKLNGEDLDWDVNRVLAIDAAVSEIESLRKTSQWYYSLDFNEKCENVQYLLAFLAKVKEKNPSAFDTIQYIEQPTSRHLKRDRDNVMHEASKIKPVVIDEALIDFQHLLLAMEMGYSGIALKTCKGQTHALLMAAAALKYNLFLCVQDLTLVGESFLHSAGLAARIPGVAAIEGNGRQYCPSANEQFKETWPTIFDIKDGTVGTGALTLTGLGHNR